MLEFYREYGAYTNPGKHVSMFSGLPESYTELCALIKAQFIHPIADLPRYQHLIPQERHNEDALYPTVETLIAGLLEHDLRGLIADRKPENRLIVTCRYHAIFLASILKSRGIPVRVRYGFARYLAPHRHIYHVICEVWNDDEQRWILIDPDREIIDLPREQFEFGNEAWRRYRQEQLDPLSYGVGDWWGAHPILDVLCHDLAAVLGAEHLYWEHPPISQDDQMDVEGLADEQIEIMNRITELLYEPEKHLQELQTLSDKHQFLQFD